MKVLVGHHESNKFFHVQIVTIVTTFPETSFSSTTDMLIPYAIDDYKLHVSEVMILILYQYFGMFMFFAFDFCTIVKSM